MDYVSKYLQLDGRAVNAEEKAEEYRSRAEESRWEQCRIAWEATSKDSPDRVMNQSEFAREVGKSQPTIARQAKVWSIYASTNNRPTYGEAMAEVSEASGTSAGGWARKDKSAAVKVLTNPALAAQLPAGALVEAIRHNPDAARAIARNADVRDAIEDEVTEQRTSQHEDNIKTWRENRNRIDGKLAKAFNTNNAVSALESAAGRIAEAIFAVEEWGVEGFEDAEREAIKRIEHLLKVYKARTNITDDDAAFLASIGVQVP